MNQAVKEFSNRRGKVSVTFDGFTYNVRYTVYSNQKSGRPVTIREFTNLDGMLAGEYFAQKYLQSKFFLPGKDGVKYVLNPLLNFTAASDVPQASYEVRGFQNGAKDVDRKDFMLFFMSMKFFPKLGKNYFAFHGDI